MKLSIISVLAIFSSAALARDYYDGHLYEARSDVLEAREAYIDAIDEYNFLAARGIVDKLKNLTPACIKCLKDCGKAKKKGQSPIGGSCRDACAGNAGNQACKGAKPGVTEEQERLSIDAV